MGRTERSDENIRKYRKAINMKCRTGEMIKPQKEATEAWQVYRSLLESMSENQ